MGGAARAAQLALRLSRRLWFLPACYAFVAVVFILLSPLLEPLMPKGLQALVDRDTLRDVFGMLASSMLAVAIFSLGTMVQAIQAAAGAATPRARSLMTADRTAQNAISTFIGASIFSLLGIIALSTGLYDDSSPVVLLTLTVLMIGLVITTLIAWIDKLSHIGGVAEAVNAVERVTANAFSTLGEDRFCGGRPAATVPTIGDRVTLGRFGHVTSIDIPALGELATTIGTELFLIVRPGAYLDPGRPVVIATGPLTDPARATITAAFVVANQREFDHDPRFGLVVLAEIASRALSPAVNDPGTAIDVVDTAVRVLAGWGDTVGRAIPAPEFPNLHVVDLDAQDLLADVFRPIARDGAGCLEVAVRLQKSLAALAALDEELFGPAARALRDDAFERAHDAMTSAVDLEELATAHAAPRAAGTEQPSLGDEKGRGR